MDTQESDTPVRTTVFAADPITKAGLTSQVRAHAELAYLDWEQRSEADVVIYGLARVSTDQVLNLRHLAAELATPVVLIAEHIEEPELIAVVSCRVVAVLPRIAATEDRLAHAVRTAAHGGGVMPPNLVGDLLKYLERLQREVLDPIGCNGSGLTSRELEVLKLMADGLDTAEIAEEMSYSERSVKHIIQGVTTRLNLRNRPHAVAYAMRAGMI